MENRDQHIDQEAAALWQALFHEPPPARASGTALLDIIARQAPIATYQSLRSPYLRPSNITGPNPAETYS